MEKIITAPFHLCGISRYRQLYAYVQFVTQLNHSINRIFYLEFSQVTF